MVPKTHLSQPLSAIQNFTYKDQHFLIGLCNKEANDQILVLNLTQNTSFTVDLDFKLQRFCLGASLVHNRAEFTEDAATENASYITPSGQNMMNQYVNDEEEPSVYLIAQSLTRQIYKIELDLETKDSMVEEQFTLEYLCTHLKSCYISGKPVVASLTANFRLYLGDKMLSSECTGFLLIQNFLLFTNTTSGVMHELHIYDLNKPLPQDHLSLAKPQAYGDFNVRAVERGSRLVTCVESRLVMQMPRGNLEGIQPRIILCKHLILMIQRKEYRKAFLLIRKHKVDLNMLFDVNPEQFYAEIDLFVRQIREVDYLNLFINSLTNEDRGRELDFMWPRKPEEVITQ